MKRRADKVKKVKGQRWPHLGKQKLFATGPPCFVCGEEITGRGIPLLIGHTTHSKTGLPTKIGQLMGDGFMVVVNTEDMLCRRCASLLNHLDKLEIDLDVVKSSLMNYLSIKYRLLDDKENNSSLIINEENCNSSDENIELMDRIKTEIVDVSSNLSPDYGYDGKEGGSGSEWEEEGATKKVNVEIILDENHSQRRNLSCLSPEALHFCAYECEKCGFATNDVAEIQQHPSVCVNYHHECRICGKKFDASKSVQEHIMQTHLSKWTCHFCSTSFSEEIEFTAHMRVHIGNRGEEDCVLKNSVGNYECNMCDFECGNKIEFDDHIRKHVVLKPFKCKDCGKRFEDELLLQEHYKSHEKIIRCDVCSLLFNEETALEEHIKCHSRPINLTREDVMVWTNKENLLQKTESLDIEKSGENNSEEDSLRDGIKFQTCAMCSLNFVNVMTYEQHMKSHSVVELSTTSKDDIMDTDNSLISSLVDSQNYVDSVIDGSLEDMFEKMHSHTESADNKPITSFVSSVNESSKDVFRCEMPTSDILKVDSEISQPHDSHCPVEEMCLTKKLISPPDALKCQETPNLATLESSNIITEDSYSVDGKIGSVLPKTTINSSILKSDPSDEKYCNKNISFENIYPLPTSIGNTDVNPGHLNNSFHVNNVGAHNIESFGDLSENNVQSHLGINIETIEGRPGIKKTYICAECGYRYSDLADLKEHFKEHKNCGSNKCPICNKTFLTKLRLKRHIKAHDTTVSGNKMTCPTCYTVFPDYFHLYQHMQDKHQKEKVVYKCEFCNEKFTSRKSYKSHEEMHPERYEYKCDECNQKFMKEKQLKDHKDAAHRDPHCRYCGKEIMKLKTLRNHELRHLRDKDNFECDVCKRVFKTKTGLRHHVAVHTGEYKYCCDYCGRGFMSRMMMEEHRSMHTKEERYVCDVCGRKFSFQSTYWIHRKWHDNPYPYKCSFCNRMFRHSSLLAVHKRKHTGERPYQCPHCPLSFPVGGTLKRHLILHTGVYPFNCESCKRGFTTRHKYATHLAKIHGDYDLLNAKQPQGEYKMVIRDEPKQHQDLSMWKFPEEGDQNELNFKLEVATAGDSMDHMETGIPCSIVPDDMLVDSGVAARVVEIVLDDESQAVATVTLAEPSPNILPELWYQ